MEKYFNIAYQKPNSFINPTVCIKASTIVEALGTLYYFEYNKDNKTSLLITDIVLLVEGTIEDFINKENESYYSTNLRF